MLAPLASPARPPPSAAAPLRLLRAVRLDATDERVFPRAAAAEEWLVTGSLLWAGCDPERLDGKRRQAFRSGFLGVASFGFASLAGAGPLDPEALGPLEARLAERLLAEGGAPDRAAAAAAARALLEDSLGLARGLPRGALLAIERRLDPRSGELVERVRKLEAGPGVHARVFEIVAEEEAAEEEADGGGAG